MKRWTVTFAAVCLAGGMSLTQAQTPAGQAGKPSGGTGQSTATKPQPPKTGQPSDTGASKMDLAFVRAAAMGGMAEVELGRLATEKAANADVKQFGQRMVDDHGKANDELKGLASRKNIELPTSLGPKHTAMRDKLSKLSGASFDRAYMAEMVRDHNHDVAEFQRASKAARDADIKGFAQKTLPTLQEHQKMARELSGKTGGPKKTGAKPGTDKQ